MCYSVYLSTTSNANLLEWGNELCKFEKEILPDDQEIVDLLQHPNKWFITRYGGCSCHFRHFMNYPDFEAFGVPEEWREEDADDIESSAATYDLFMKLLDSESELDVVSVWTDCTAEEVTNLEVRLADIPRDSFRFVENVMFSFVR